MAMEFGKYGKITVGEVTKTAATEGGAIVAGMLGSGVLGKRIEVMVKPGVVPDSPAMDKIIAWTGNNAPKLAAWYMVKKEGEKFLGGYGPDIGKGILASVALDSITRGANDFAPKDTLSIGGIALLGNQTENASSGNMQKVLQENSSLRNQLNGALQRVASATSPVSETPTVTVTPMQTPPPDHDRAYGMMSESPDARREEFGTMEAPIIAERERKFGTMNKAELNFAGETQIASAAYGML